MRQCSGPGPADRVQDASTRQVNVPLAALVPLHGHAQQFVTQQRMDNGTRRQQCFTR